MVGLVFARDILKVPEREAGQRTVRELMRRPMFVPETKFGSELLKEMRRKSEQIAIVIDEYGLVAGIVTVEDLVEEIIGEIEDEDRAPAPDVVREPSGSLVLRGSVSVEKLKELFGIEIEVTQQNAGAATLSGLLNSVVGPRACDRERRLITTACNSKCWKPISARCCGCARGVGWGERNRRTV